MINNKKGGIPDGFFLIVAFFALAIVAIFMFSVVSKFNDHFQESGLITSSAKEISDTMVGKYPDLFDKIFLFVVVGLGIAVLAGAWFINSHPALFWISLPITAFMIWMSAVFSNIFTEITTHEGISPYANEFVYTLFIFKNFVTILTVYSLLLMLVLYSKTRQK